MVYIHNGILLNHEINEIWPFAATWMDLEMIILSEGSQKEKNKYRMLKHIYMESKTKMVLTNLGGRTGIKTQT